MTRMVVCDLDGTLLPANSKSLPKSVFSDIRRLCDKGVLFAVASGRPYDDLAKLFGELKSRIVFICLDGALVMWHNCVIYKNRLCKIEAGKLLTLNCKKQVFGRDKIIDVDENGKGDAVNLLGGEVYKLALHGFIPPKNSAYRVCYQKNGITELVSPTADKADALRAVLEKFNISAEDVKALGDGENDQAMLAFVGKGFRTENCADILKSRGFPISSVEEILKI